MSQKNFDVRDYSYVFCTKKRLELVQACKHSSGLVGLRKKWATAAILTLASGSVFIFSPNGQVKAAENSNVAKQVSNSEKQTDVADSQARQQNILIQCWMITRRSSRSTLFLLLCKVEMKPMP